MLMVTITILVQLIVTGCPLEEEPPHYYDYAGVGISTTAATYLASLYTNTVYTGRDAKLILEAVVEYPDSNTKDAYYEKRTYDELIDWLDRYKLPHKIAEAAKDDISAYMYVDVNYNLWAVFAEDVTDYYRGVMPKKTLGNTVTLKDGYPQEKAITE
jgi:hypothetical protein